MRKLLTTATLSLLLSAPLIRAQTPAILPLDQIHSQPELEATIRTLDSAVFNAYNRCDLPKFSALFTEDVEFYHDQGGVTLGNTALTESIRKNICGHVTRELTPGTLKVYPMKGIGAIEMGAHRFFENGNPVASGEADFTMLWVYRKGAWKISRVLSYNHRATTK